MFVASKLIEIIHKLRTTTAKGFYIIRGSIIIGSIFQESSCLWYYYDHFIWLFVVIKNSGSTIEASLALLSIKSYISHAVFVGCLQVVVVDEAKHYYKSLILISLVPHFIQVQHVPSLCDTLNCNLLMSHKMYWEANQHGTTCSNI